MNLGVKSLSWFLVWSAAAGLATGGVAAAQDAAPAAASSPVAPATPTPSGSSRTPTKSTAQIDAGEPRANTSPGSSGGASSAEARGAAAPAGTAAGPLMPSAAAPAAGSPATPPRTAVASRAPHPAGQKAPGTADHVNLSTATVTGDREQPKVMYIVPWKKSDIGDLSGKPMNSLLDEALAPVDRDEFKREVAYYGAVTADTSQNGAPNAAAQGEK